MGREQYSVERAKALYARFSFSEVARRLGVKPWRVRRDLLQEADVEVRPQGHQREYEVPPRETLLELRETRKLSQGRAAREMGVSKHTFQNWLKIRNVR